MSSIAEFAENELDQIKDILTQTYQKDVEIQLADCDILLKPEDHETCNCPTVFWYKDGVNFMVSKLSAMNYKAQFFYTPHEQFGTNISQYNNLSQCVAAVLQSQDDHQREKQNKPA